MQQPCTQTIHMTPNDVRQPDRPDTAFCSVSTRTTATHACHVQLDALPACRLTRSRSHKSHHTEEVQQVDHVLPQREQSKVPNLLRSGIPRTKSTWQLGTAFQIGHLTCTVHVAQHESSDWDSASRRATDMARRLCRSVLYSTMEGGTAKGAQPESRYSGGGFSRHFLCLSLGFLLCMAQLLTR